MLLCPYHCWSLSLNKSSSSSLSLAPSIPFYWILISSTSLSLPGSSTSLPPPSFSQPINSSSYHETPSPDPACLLSSAALFFPFSLLNLLKGRSTLTVSTSSLPNHFPTCCNWFIPTTLRTLTKAEILNWKLKDVFNVALTEYKSFWNCC